MIIELLGPGDDGNKQVMFSDGVVPGGELAAELDENGRRSGSSSASQQQQQQRRHRRKHHR